MSLGERILWITLLMATYAYLDRDSYTEQKAIEVRSVSLPQAAYGHMDAPFNWSATVEQGGKIRHYTPTPKERNF